MIVVELVETEVSYLKGLTVLLIVLWKISC
jgi:hypothetical protein